MKKRILELIDESGIKCNGREHKSNMVDRIIGVYYAVNNEFEESKDDVQRALMVIRAVQSGSEKIEAEVAGEKVFDEKMAEKAGDILIDAARKISERFGGIAGEFLDIVENERVGSSVTASSICDICVLPAMRNFEYGVTIESVRNAIHSSFESLVSIIAENEEFFSYPSVWDIVSLIMDAAYIYRWR